MDPATLHALAAFPDQLEAFYATVPSTHAHWTPPSWDGIPSELLTPIEQICHVRDIEIDGYQVRIERALSEANPTLGSIDTYGLAAERKYADADADAVLAEFRAARRRTIERIAQLDAAELERRAEFEGYGPVTVRGLIHYLCSHDQQHLAGLQWLLGKIEAPAPNDVTTAERIKVLETERLILRHLHADDAPFILELLNDPAWLRYIGDKGVRTPDDARAYIRNGPADMYARFGFGLWRVERKDDGAPIGLCGLIKRDTLPDVDIGFAFLPAFRAQGYARESAAATLAHARDVLKLPRVVAIVSPGNDSSAALLEKVGLRFERTLQLSGRDEVNYFAIDF